MATAQLTASVSTKGATKAARELKAVGTQATKTESNVINMGNSFKSVGKNASTAAAAINGPLGGISSRITAVTSLLSSGAVVATSFGVAITALGFALSEGVQELDRINVELAKTEAILKATGEASGKTSTQLLEQARSIGLATLASTQGIQQAQAKLLTFDKIQGQVFDDAIMLAQDLATVFGGDASAQATQLGKALQDPVKGLTALNRVGVSFTKQQEDQVKAMVAAGEVMKAQAVITEALKNQVGGAGEAVAKNSLAGKIDTVGQLWSEFSGKLADSTGALTTTDQILRGMIISLNQWNEALAPESTTDLFSKRLDIMMDIADLEERIEAGGSTRSIERLKSTLVGLRSQADSLYTQITGQAAEENAESLKASDAHEKSQLKILADSTEFKLQIEEDARNRQVMADLDFFDKREAYTIEQNKLINAANEEAYADDAETYATFLKLKEDEDKRLARAKRRTEADQISALGDTTDSLKTALGEQSALYKTAAIAETTINTYKSATGAYSALASIPIVGPALGGAAAGVAIAAGLANVQAITAVREQGGNLSTGQASTVAERDQVEVFIPSSNGKVKTANQLSAIGGGGMGSNVSLTVIDQSGGAKEYSQEQRTDGEIVLLIRNTVSADISTSNTQIDKSLTSRGQVRQRA